MKSAGYATACIGKWHLGHKEEYLPTNHGFDYYFGIPYSNDMDRIIEVKSMQGYMDFWKSEERHNTNNFNVPLIRNMEIIERPADQNTITRRYTDESIAFILENREKPFFIYLAHNLPHVPLFASKEFLGKSKRGLYGDVVQEIDDGVGRILQTLRDTGLDEKTMVIFTSDNGPWLIMQQESGSAGLLRGGKGSTWEGGMRVPGIFWLPGRIEPDVVADVGTTMDIFTTLSKLAGVPLPDDRTIDGKDLSPVLFEGKKSTGGEVFYYRGQDLFAVRMGDYKAHFITQSGYAQDRTDHDPPLLYNLAVDPSEKFNIADEHPEIIGKILELAGEHNQNMVKGTDLLEARGE
jgi:arylsulfatase A-like enzyme